MWGGLTMADDFGPLSEIPVSQPSPETTRLPSDHLDGTVPGVAAVHAVMSREGT
jgi:hypothetical protein